MLPKFANPHSLSLDVETTTRSAIARQAGHTLTVEDEDGRSLLDTLLQNTWSDALAKTQLKKHRKTVKKPKNENDLLTFRLVSSMKHPRYISLDPKPPPTPVTREPECEDDETQAKVRSLRAQSAAVDFKSLGEVHPKPIAVEAKVPLASQLSFRSLPPFLVTEEVRPSKRIKARHSQTGAPGPSPHEPRATCIVLPVKSASDNIQRPRKRCRSAIKERPAPAYWRPPPDVRGKSLGYALGYPSNWSPDRLYVRDTLKRGVGST